MDRGKRRLGGFVTGSKKRGIMTVEKWRLGPCAGMGNFYSVSKTQGGFGKFAVCKGRKAWIRSCLELAKIR